MHQLADKVAIITGASSGIGRAAATLFAAAGARLVLVARRRPELDTLAAEIAATGGAAVVVAGDVGDEATARAAVAAAVDRFGKLDIAFNNAGTMGTAAPTPEIDPAVWRTVVDVNLTGAYYAARHQIPAMRAAGGGTLLYTSTFVGHTVGFPGMAAYAASKAGVIGLVQVIAAEFGTAGIRANALLPGGTDTPMGRDAMPTPEARRFVEGLHALKRIAAPEEIARAALWLVSDAASFVTGAAIRVDGGVSIART